MIPTIVVVDNASPVPGEIRSSALKFEPQVVEFGGYEFPGIIHNEGLEQVMRDIMCPIISDGIGWKVAPGLSFFRLGVADHDPQTYIHADRVGCSHAAVLYLTPDGEGGTAFWRHNELGTTYIPPNEELERRGITPDDAFFKRITEEGLEESFWTMTDLVGWAYNRLAIFNGHLFHSRYPKQYSGASNETGRLVWVCFFNIQ